MQHTWSILNLERNLSDGLVTTASYTCNTTCSGSMKRMVGDCPLPTKSPSDPNFVPYSDLTEEMVLTWVTGSIDYLAIETSNSASVAEQINYEQSKTTDDGVPW